MSALADALAATRSDFVFVNPDTELQAIAEVGLPGVSAHPLPSPAVLATWLDKAATVAAVQGSEDFPRTFPRIDPRDLDRAFRELEPPVWLRATVGAGGRGSIPVEEPAEARFWMEYWRRRGRADRWVAQEYLPGRNLNWTALYVRGRLVASASMVRLRYFLGEASVSGITGQTSLGTTIDPAECAAVSARVVRRLDPQPHGLYSVDLREDRHGRLRVTEINPRLAGRPWLYTKAGVNLPLASVRAEDAHASCFVAMVGHPESGRSAPCA